MHFRAELVRQVAMPALERPVHRRTANHMRAKSFFRGPKRVQVLPQNAPLSSLTAAKIPWRRHVPLTSRGFCSWFGARQIPMVRPSPAPRPRARFPLGRPAPSLIC
jgi:hypothetical protein